MPSNIITCFILCQTWNTLCDQARRVKNRSGVEIDAHFSIEPKDGWTTVVIESKGGGTTSRHNRNENYDLGFKYLLERLALKGAIINDVAVDSQTPKMTNLSLDDRRLQLDGNYGCLIILSGISELEELRIALCRARYF
jgi:hypothetical protein